MLCIVLYTSVCDQGHVVIKVKRDCRIAISNRSHDRLRIWRPMDEMENDTFPRLKDQLRELTFGVYQLWLSTSYIQEHLEGNCEIRVDCRRTKFALCQNAKSSHIEEKTFMMWINFNEFFIQAWYFQCKAGLRVVGMCSHLAAIV